MTEQIPTVGRIVHYIGSVPDANGMVAAGPCRAAIVTEVRDVEECSLTVFHPEYGATSYGQSRHDESKSIGTWHWPERV